MERLRKTFRSLLKPNASIAILLRVPCITTLETPKHQQFPITPETISMPAQNTCIAKRFNRKVLKATHARKSINKKGVDITMTPASRKEDIIYANQLVITNNFYYRQHCWLDRLYRLTQEINMVHFYLAHSNLTEETRKLLERYIAYLIHSRMDSTKAFLAFSQSQGVIPGELVPVTMVPDDKYLVPLPTIKKSVDHVYSNNKKKKHDRYLSRARANKRKRQDLFMKQWIDFDSTDNRYTGSSKVSWYQDDEEKPEVIFEAPSEWLELDATM